MIKILSSERAHLESLLILEAKERLIPYINFRELWSYDTTVKSTENCPTCFQKDIYPPYKLLQFQKGILGNKISCCKKLDANIFLPRRPKTLS